MKQKTIKNNSSSLSKYLAQAGVASRRKVLELIEQGLIKVNQVIIKEPGYKITSADEITYRDRPVQVEQKIYILLNKPKDYITTVSDQKGRKTVMSLIAHAIPERLYPVGRLDRNTTGLLIVTNDGQLALQLAHPRYNVQKVYAVTLDSPLRSTDIEKIKKGLHLEDGLIQVDSLQIIPKTKNEVRVSLHSGKNRIVRRIFEHLGYQVIKLDRIEYAGLTQKNLLVGQWRYLSAYEIEKLHAKKINKR